MNGQNESRYESEMRIAAAIQRGYNDMEQGRVRPWGEARQLVDSIREPRSNETPQSRLTQKEPSHECEEEPLAAEERAIVLQSYALAMRGELADAKEALARIRAKYGL